MRNSRKHLEAVRNFMYHLMVFLFVNGLLVIVDVRAGVGERAIVGLDWAYWLILFWGMGLMGHAISAFFGDYTLDEHHDPDRAEHPAIR